MKKLINEVDNVVDEMLEGMVAAYPQYIRRLEGFDVVVRAGGSQGKVALVSGGGSGHEPAHGGYVGKGMLDGAIAGAVFTSPTPDQVYEAIKAADGGKGVLLVIKNYTGDVMNFEMAADKSESQCLTPSSQGHACEMRRGGWGRASILLVMPNEAPDKSCIDVRVGL